MPAEVIMASSSWGLTIDDVSLDGNILIVKKDSLRCPVQIIVLSAPQCPHEGGKAYRTKRESHRDQKEEIRHT